MKSLRRYRVKTKGQTQKVADFGGDRKTKSLACGLALTGIFSAPMAVLKARKIRGRNPRPIIKDLDRKMMRVGL